MEAEKHKRLDAIIAEEDLDRTKFDGLLERYLFTNKIPLEHDVITAMKTQPSILQRATIAERIR